MSAPCCEKWPGCDCDIELLDPDDDDSMYTVHGRRMTHDEYMQWSYDPEPRSDRE